MEAASKSSEGGKLRGKFGTKALLIY